MIRRLMPLVSILFFVLLDTAVIPEFYYGACTIPLTLAVTGCISICFTTTRFYGVLYGMIGGLLIDVSVGTLGIMTFFFMVYGFLYNIIIIQELSGSQSSEKNPLEFRRENSLLWITGTAALLYLLHELIVLIYRAFFTYTFVLDFSWRYVLFMLIRSLLFATATLILFPFLRKLYGINTLRRKRAIKEGMRF